MSAKLAHANGICNFRVFGMACLFTIKLCSQVTLFRCISLWLYIGIPVPILSAKLAHANGNFRIRHVCSISVHRCTVYDWILTLSHIVSQARPRQWNMQLPRLWNGMCSLSSRNICSQVTLFRCISLWLYIGILTLSHIVSQARPRQWNATSASLEWHVCSLSSGNICSQHVHWLSPYIVSKARPRQWKFRVWHVCSHQGNITGHSFRCISLWLYIGILTLSHIVSQARPRQWNMQLPRLWNGMFVHYHAEISVHRNLPVHQSMTVHWDFNPVPYCQPSSPTPMEYATSASLEWHVCSLVICSQVTMQV